jgi:hypothetical protein
VQALGIEIRGRQRPGRAERCAGLQHAARPRDRIRTEV